VEGASASRRLLPALTGVALGALAGLAAFTFVYARGYSYLQDDPAACVNCHVMAPQYEGWLKGSHRAVATCNDCHTPHGFAAKYATKALNGWNHSLAFTTGDFPEPIRATSRNRRIAQEACAKCHETILDSMGAAAHGEPLACVRCHGSVGHPAT
jgi:cytochrome c nitrite reductase small subunit